MKLLSYVGSKLLVCFLVCLFTIFVSSVNIKDTDLQRVSLISYDLNSSRPKPYSVVQER